MATICHTWGINSLNAVVRGGSRRPCSPESSHRALQKGISPKAHLSAHLAWLERLPVIFFSGRHARLWQRGVKLRISSLSLWVVAVLRVRFWSANFVSKSLSRPTWPLACFSSASERLAPLKKIRFLPPAIHMGVSFFKGSPPQKQMTVDFLFGFP